ncbi:MAG: hypothetical protein FWC39_10995 [Bacteroidetes bacterium]|nr:hypothetical protein [Bacteroidota bacterium]
MEKLYQYIEEPPMQLQEPAVAYQRTFRTPLEVSNHGLSAGITLEEMEERINKKLSAHYGVDFNTL